MKPKEATIVHDDPMVNQGRVTLPPTGGITVETKGGMNELGAGPSTMDLTSIMERHKATNNFLNKLEDQLERICRGFPNPPPAENLTNHGNSYVCRKKNLEIEIAHW